MKPFLLVPPRILWPHSFGWIYSLDNYYNQIYSSYNDKKYVEVSIVTKDYINPFPYDINVQYQGIVNEYLGNMPIKNN